VLDEVQTYVPARRRVPLRELWTSREVTRIIALRDIKVKYKQSALGPLWLLFQPLGTLAAVTIAFSAVVGVDTGDVPYLLFALVGLAVWNFVQLSMSASTDVLIRNSILVRRSVCPRTALISAQLASNLPPFLVLFVFMLGATIVSEGLPLQVLLLPVLVAWLMVFAWGVVLIIGSLSARFRDAVSAIPLIAQFGIFLSPVGYPVSQADGLVSVLLALNPVTGLIEAWRWCILGMPIEIGYVIVALVSTSLITLFGWRLFTRMEVRFADYV
jgi:ABC-type polysaccharide/polyol phosphate export permease